MKKSILRATGLAVIAAAFCILYVTCNDSGANSGKQDDRADAFVRQFNKPSSGDGGGGKHVHTWGDWEVTTAPTCTAPGVETKICTQDTSHKETRVIPMLAGTDCASNPAYTCGGWVVMALATCDAPGTETKICTHGDDRFDSTRTIPVLTGAACNRDTTYTLTIYGNPSTGGTTNPEGSQTGIKAGQPVNISATANIGYKFTGWTTYGDKALIDNRNSASTSVTLSGNASITANYAASPFISNDTLYYGATAYRMVTIGGRTWMAKNLGFYSWWGANEACPNGWHLPTNQEWAALVSAAGGSNEAGRKLKSTDGWYNDGNGTDNYGFSAEPGGYENDNKYGFWWTATEIDEYDAVVRIMYYDTDNVGEGSDLKGEYRAVRCVRDAR